MLTKVLLKQYMPSWARAMRNKMQIQDYQNLKQCDLKSLKNLAQEIRSFILESVHKQGGHVASNLGMVEITLA